eukprot:TRINITY_DN51285_c0_g1_i1.p1 TRINITY_DN51285_c0_g1~~TRINITY_DN51285_c0_g1_i1.p1  ORF type:complete len:252 (-),score=24.35 TRINITY_DN51285_c0_g1_i1:31-756(-)
MRQHVHQPGCAGQHRKGLNPFGCKYHAWVDTSNHSRPSLSTTAASPPNCLCGLPSVYRRVMSIRNNGKIFSRCKHRRCSIRYWLIPDTEKHMSNKSTTTPITVRRWQRRCRNTEGWGETAGSGPQHQSSENTLGEDSEEPLTSGSEADEDDSCDSLGVLEQNLKLMSLEASRQRLSEARPPEAPPVFEKRWKCKKIQFSAGSGGCRIEDPLRSGSFGMESILGEDSVHSVLSFELFSLDVT